MTTSKTVLILAPLALLATLLANIASAQVLDWLPVSDLPLTYYEVGGRIGIPAASSMCMWDPDGDGPRPRCVVVAGELALPPFSPNKDVAFLDADGWNAIETPQNNAYSMTAYRAPLAAREALFYGSGSAGIFRLDGSVWTRISTLTLPKTMTVLDLDGDGPEPAKLLVGSRNTVNAFDGTSFTQIGSAQSSSSIYSMCMCDVDGQLCLLAAGNAGISKWNGSQWSLMAATTGGSAWSMCKFDTDGNGPLPPELVVSGDFDTLGGVTTGPVAVLRNGTWVGLGATSLPANHYIARSVSFDPDGPGPMTPRLVVSGRFNMMGGVSVPNLAYYHEGAWHAFPDYWSAETFCIGINDEAGFSDSPQLVVAGFFGNRPGFGIIALSDTAPGYRNDPAGGRRPAGETLSLGVIPTGDELSFRWYKGNTPVISGTTASGSIISGAASPRLTIANLTPEDEGEYHLTVGNGFGTVTTQSASVSLGCAADFNADDIVDFADYLDFISAFVNSDPVSDFNVDLQFDLFDYLDYVQHFAEGC